MKTEWGVLRERHKDFWNRGTTDRPLVGTKRTTAFTQGSFQFPAIDRPLRPDDLGVDRVLRWAEELYLAGNGFLDGDLVWGAPVFPGIPWMEAIMGCPIRVSMESQSAWADHWLEDWDAIECIFPLSTNPWFVKLIELTEALVIQADGRYPVTQTLMRGPADVLAALRGHEQLCLDFYLHPQDVCDLARLCTDVWIDVARAQMALIPPFVDGYTAPRLEVWAPGQLVRYEEDAAILFSSQVYRQFFRDCDKRIAASFDFAIIHTHSADRKLINDLLDVRELPAIQCLIDPNGPSVGELIPAFQNVQAAGKALLITHELDDEGLRPVLEALSPCGLALERMTSV